MRGLAISRRPRWRPQELRGQRKGGRSRPIPSRRDRRVGELLREGRRGAQDLADRPARSRRGRRSARPPCRRQIRPPGRFAQPVGLAGERERAQPDNLGALHRSSRRDFHRCSRRISSRSSRPVFCLNSSVVVVPVLLRSSSRRPDCPRPCARHPTANNGRGGSGAQRAQEKRCANLCNRATDTLGMHLLPCTPRSAIPTRRLHEHPWPFLTNTISKIQLLLL